jgi:signal transduction histidine kinase
MKHERFFGIVLECDPEGMIQKVIHNDLEISDAKLVGRMFSGLMEVTSRRPSFDFLLSIRNKRVVINVPLTIGIDTHAMALVFTGIDLESALWIIGSESTTETIQYLNHLQQINNDQANHIRRLLKEKLSQGESSVEQSLQDQLQFNEISGLNNELVNLQRELLKRNTELARINTLKNQFLGMAAHDLRNPLAAVMAFSELLIEELSGAISDQQQKFLQLIFSSSEYMLSLIEDLLDVSKIESGLLSLNLRRLNTRVFMREVLELNRILAERKGVELIELLEDAPEYLMIDQRKMEQVLNNLIGNAIKFSSRGGKVEVEVGSLADEYFIRIKDHGTGMSASQVEGLFKPYTLMSSPGTEGERGTGLGLFIAKRVVEGHRGIILVESEPGKGSTFRVNLPI